jgi:hypothetical protein
MTEYLTSQELAERYGISPLTVKQWRRRTKQSNSPHGPPWEEYRSLQPGGPHVRYKLSDVKAWEKEHKINPNTLH